MKTKIFLVALVALVAGLFMTTSCKKADELVGTTWEWTNGANCRQIIHFESRTEITLEMQQLVDAGTGEWAAFHDNGSCLIVGSAMTIVWPSLGETWAGIIRSTTIEMAEDVEDQDDYEYEYIFRKK